MKHTDIIRQGKRYREALILCHTNKNALNSAYEILAFCQAGEGDDDFIGNVIRDPAEYANILETVKEEQYIERMYSRMSTFARFLEAFQDAKRVLVMLCKSSSDSFLPIPDVSEIIERSVVKIINLSIDLNIIIDSALLPIRNRSYKNG